MAGGSCFKNSIFDHQDNSGSCNNYAAESIVLAHSSIVMSLSTELRRQASRHGIWSTWYFQTSSYKYDCLGRFTDRFLRPDGVFLLQMIASHAGNLTCAKVNKPSRSYQNKLFQLTEALWMIFLRRSGNTVVEEKTGDDSERGDWERESVGTHREHRDPTVVLWSEHRALANK